MTYHYNITKNRASKGARLLTDRIFLSLLLLTTLVITYYNTSEENLLIALTCIVLFAAGALVLSRRQKIPFVEISNGTMTYFDTVKGELISLPVNDITHISTRFCELNVHTANNVHSLNLDLIRSEKARWEIKEMIREMTRSPQRELRIEVGN
ncbi:hypothetical protein [Daejeonella lutea]|uniref:Uncharacterized protein n=1 Tax=Daejeonella lutea TaxID=572036 RepID=A0A1T5CVX0_9SPHI|nr:hypothetical protein [Daejeonella lutea]SKB63564.1 hypothetical protein SAMN05661099_1937 [Daejeonella lutea]